MKELIQALQIFLKYGDMHYPTHCEHDILIVAVDPKIVSIEDKETLNELGFLYNKDKNGELGDDVFFSYRYGSC